MTQTRSHVMRWVLALVLSLSLIQVLQSCGDDIDDYLRSGPPHFSYRR